jgi:hypothetical protein
MIVRAPLRPTLGAPLGKVRVLHGTRLRSGRASRLAPPHRMALGIGVGERFRIDGEYRSSRGPVTKLEVCDESAISMSSSGSHETPRWREMDSNYRSRFTYSPFRDPLLSAP